MKSEWRKVDMETLNGEEEFKQEERGNKKWDRQGDVESHQEYREMYSQTKNMVAKGGGGVMYMRNYMTIRHYGWGERSLSTGKARRQKKEGCATCKKR